MNPLREPEIVWRKVGDQAIIYHKKSRNVHILNKTAMEIWMLCDGNHDIENIATTLSTTFSASKEEVKEDITRTIADLNRYQLLKNS